MTWKQIFNTKWFGAVFNVAAMIIIFILGQAIMGRNNTRSAINKKLDEKADLVYVNQQDKLLQVSIDKTKEEQSKADEQLKADLVNSVNEINTNLREVRNYIYSIKKGAAQ